LARVHFSFLEWLKYKRKKGESGMTKSGARIFLFSFFAVFLFFSPSIAQGQNCLASIVGGPSFGDGVPNPIQAAINLSPNPYTQINISGNCSVDHYIFISELKDYLTLAGNPSATITGTNANEPVILTIGRGIRIKNLLISGGLDAIQVTRGGTAFIETNTIQEAGRYGIVISTNSYAYLWDNTIINNAVDGVIVVDSSTATIGIQSSTDEVAHPNVISGNQNGITLARSSSARIVGNTIMNNSNDGIRISKVSQADISNNRIQANGGSGIFVTQNSGVNLGRDTGATIFDLPNFSDASNGTYGVSCSIGGYADGRLGTLKGNNKKNTTNFSGDCINSLIP
jgi:parallel beta-helix repeat protein